MPDVSVEFLEPEIVTCRSTWVCGVIKVTNKGKEPVSDVRVGVDIPAVLTLPATYNQAWQLADGKAVATVAGPLAAGQSAELRLALKVGCDVELNGAHTVTASVTSFAGADRKPATDAAPGDNTDSATVKIGQAGPARCAR